MTNKDGSLKGGCIRNAVSPEANYSVAYDASWAYYAMGYVVSLLSNIPGVTIELRQDVAFTKSTVKAIGENAKVPAVSDHYRPLVEIAIEKKLWASLKDFQSTIPPDSIYMFYSDKKIIIDNIEVFIVITEQNGTIVPLEKNAAGFFADV